MKTIKYEETKRKYEWIVSRKYKKKNAIHRKNTIFFFFFFALSLL